MMMNSIDNILLDSSPDLQKVILQYWELVCLPVLSGTQQEQLAEILEGAMESEILTFWITEIDHIIGHRLGDLDSEERISYQNQQAFLREHLPINSGIKSENFSQNETLENQKFYHQVSSFYYPPNCLH